MPRQYIRGTVSERFWPKVARSDGCWPWTAAKYPNGYGSFRGDAGCRGAHVVAWKLAGGRALFPNEGIYHTCDFKGCVRNDDEGIYEIDGVPHERHGHLWIGTQADNMRDMQTKGRGALGDRNSSRIRPERLPRGERHPARIDPSYLARGERQWCAKLTAADIQVIRSEYAAGARLAALSRQYGVTEGTIRAVVQRKTWKHLEGGDPMASPRLQHASSRWAGVDWHRRAGKWRARVRINGQDRYLGLFATEEEARAAIAGVRAEAH